MPTDSSFYIVLGSRSNSIITHYTSYVQYIVQRLQASSFKEAQEIGKVLRKVVVVVVVASS